MASRAWPARAAELAFMALLGPTWAAIAIGLDGVRPGPYRLDFYTEVGPAVWAGIVVGTVATVALLYASGRFTRLAYANMGALYLATLAMPTLAGYFSYGRSDALTIIGSIAGAARRGTVYPENLYPGTDFVGATLQLFTGLHAHQVFALLGLLASLTTLLVLCAFVRRAMPGRSLGPAYLAAFVLYFAWIQATGTPNFVFLAVAGALLYVAVAIPHHGTGRLVALQVLGAAVVIGHPFVAAFTLIAVVGLMLTGRSDLRLDLALASALILGLLVLFALTNPGLGHAVQANWDAFQTSLSDPVFLEAHSKADVLDLSALEWAQFAAFYFMRYVVPFAAIGLAWALAVGRGWRRTQPAWAWVLLAAGFAMQALLLFNPIVSHTAIRVANINYMVFGLVPLFAVALGLLASRARSGPALSASLLLLAILPTLFGAYDSPRTFLPNEEFGEEEVLGARWLTTERGVASIFNPLGVFEYRSMTLLYDTLPKNNPLRPVNNGLLADHFEHNATTWPRPFYIAVPLNDIVRYPELYPQIGRFTYEDFERLDENPEMARIYASDGFHAYLYRPTT